jgi:hypothetical protein
MIVANYRGGDIADSKDKRKRLGDSDFVHNKTRHAGTHCSESRTYRGTKEEVLSTL